MDTQEERAESSYGHRLYRRAAAAAPVALSAPATRPAYRLRSRSATTISVPASMYALAPTLSDTGLYSVLYNAVTLRGRQPGRTRGSLEQGEGCFIVANYFALLGFSLKMRDSELKGWKFGHYFRCNDVISD